MLNKQGLRSEETKSEILSAAEKLFSKRGFNSVSIREIAKEAGCSHTTIYIYFENKEELLYQLSKPPLQNLKQQMEIVLQKHDRSPEIKLRDISKEFIRLCLSNRNMHTIFFNVKADRVDVKEPDLEINKLRNELFGLLKEGLQQALQVQQDNHLLLAFSRIYFYTLNGIVSTYTESSESVEMLMERLETTFEDSIEVLLFGFKGKMKKGS